MSTKQWGILLVGVVLFSLSELFPPWQFKHVSWFRECPAGYHLFNSPPVLKSSNDLNWMCRSSDEPILQDFRAHKNITRLNWQRAILVSLTLGLLLLFFDRRSFIKSLFSGITLFIGISGLILYAISVHFEGW
jgi:hypothetical protein